MESEKNGTSPNTKSRDDLENGANLKNGKSSFVALGTVARAATRPSTTLRSARLTLTGYDYVRKKMSK